MLRLKKSISIKQYLKNAFKLKLLLNCVNKYF